MIKDIGIIVFLVSCIAVEVIRARSLPLRTSWISTYLTGPWGWIEDLGFVALAVALFSTGDTWGFPAGIALLICMGSRVFLPYVWADAERITRIHVISAGLAFVFAILWVLVSGSGTGILVIILVLIADGVIYFSKENDVPRQQLMEKLTALGIGLAGLLV